MGNQCRPFIAGEDASDVLEEAKTGFLWGAGGAGVLAGAGAAFSKLSPFARQMAAKLDNDAVAGKLMSVDEAIATRGATREMVKDFTETQLEKARVRAPMVFREYMDRQLRSLGERGIDPKELTVDAQARWETAVRAKGGSINMQDNIFSRPEIKDYAESVSTATSSGSSYTINLERICRCY